MNRLFFKNKIKLKSYFIWVLAIFGAFSVTSCKYHTQHYMFQTEKSIVKTDSSLFEFSEDNYILQINDWFELNVYTNNGELLIDPNKELKTLIGGGAAAARNGVSFENQKYLVLENGKVRFPMVDYIAVDGRSIIDVEKELQEKFSEFYVDPYVRIKPLNKRVILFTGKGGKVIPLNNENMNLLEVLALGGEIATGSNAQNVNIIRGDLKDPEVLKVDLSTIEGLKQYNLKVLPNDVIYVQAKRNRVSEFVRDLAPLISVTSSITILIISLSRI